MNGAQVKNKVFLTGGDGFGWALDEDLRNIRLAIEDYVEFTNIYNADLVISPWWKGIVQHGTNNLQGKKIICGLDNPISYWLTQPDFREVSKIVNLWLSRSNKLSAELSSIGYYYHHLPYGLGKNLFEPLPAIRKEDIRKAFNIPLDSYIIGNFQRDTLGENLDLPKIQKGPDIFRIIVRELHRKLSNIHVVLAGPRRHWLYRSLLNDGIPCTFIGSITDADDIGSNIRTRKELSELYALLDLYLLTSRWEGGPYGLIEASSTRTKILTTDVGVARDILEKGCIFDSVDQAIRIILADIKEDVLNETIDYNQMSVEKNCSEIKIKEAGEKLIKRFNEIDSFNKILEPAKSIKEYSEISIISRAKRIILKKLPRFSSDNTKSISFLREFKKPPYGGGNQFMLALKNSLERQGVRVLNNKVGEYIDGYLFDSLWFDLNLLDKLAKIRNKKVIHRIDGPIYLYRGKDKELDDKIFEINRTFATTTVIQSWFTLTKILSAGYKPINPVIIRNACNSAIFNAKHDRQNHERASNNKSRKLRLISSSWSDNPRKGADIYKWLDNNLDFSIYDYRFIGRVDCDFKNIIKVPPMPSEELSRELKYSDVYITASQNDPCSNALIEALTSGIPAVFLNSGGHPELVGYGGIGFDNVNQIPEILIRISDFYDAFQDAIYVESIDQVAKEYLACL